MATSPWALPTTKNEVEEQTIPNFFSAMGLPAPVSYQPDSGMFAQLMSNFGGFNPQNPTPTQDQQEMTAPPTSLAPGDSGTLQPSPAWGPYSQFGLPTPPEGQDLGSWDFWGQGAEAMAPISNFYNIMGPWLGQLQSQYESSRDFTESAERFDRQQDWTEYMDAFTAAIQERQQQVAENDRATALWQWMESFNRQGRNDAFSQQMSLQNLLLNMARLQEQSRAANLNAWGRDFAPARIVSNWG